MKREKLLRSKEYWLVQIQNDLFGIIENYMQEKKINRSKLASELKVTKGYITQLLSGDFDHKISKLVELSLASGKAPILSFVDLEKFIKDDANDKVPIQSPVYIAYKEGLNTFAEGDQELEQETINTRKPTSSKKKQKKRI